MIRFAVSLSVDEAAGKLIAAIAAYPMGLVAHAKGWAAEKAAGIDIPLRIHLYEAGGRTWVAYRPATDVFKPYVNPQLDVLGSELDAIFNQLLATLDPWKLP